MKLPQSFLWRLNWVGSNVSEWRLFNSPRARRLAAQRVIIERGWLGVLAASLIASVLPVAMVLLYLGILQNVAVPLSLGYALTVPLAFILLRRQMRRSLRREHGQMQIQPCWECGQIVALYELKNHICKPQTIQPLKRSA